MSYEDPHVKAWLDVFLEQMKDAPSPQEMSMEEWRSMNSQFWKTVDPGPAGDIRCKLYVPRKTDKLLPALAYFHGGGVCILSPDDYHGQSSVLSEEADCIVLAPAYRLAPEHPCPAALDDCYAVMRYLQEKGNEIGVDQQRIAIAADSGGEDT